MELTVLPHDICLTTWLSLISVVTNEKQIPQREEKQKTKVFNTGGSARLIFSIERFSQKRM